MANKDYERVNTEEPAMAPAAADSTTSGAGAESTVMDTWVGRGEDLFTSARSEARPWGEFFSFKQMGVPKTTEIERWCLDNLSRFRGNFLILLYGFLVFSALVNPISTLIAVGLLYVTAKQDAKEGNPGVFMSFLRCVAFLIMIGYGLTAVSSAGFLVALRLVFFRPFDDVEAPADTV